MKHYHWILIVMLLLAACAAPATPTAPASSPLGTPAPGESPLGEPSPDGSPLPTPEPALASAAHRRVADALTPLVADRLDTTPGKLHIVEMEQVTWNDASLGCPQPDQMYAQVLTPGWRAVYEDADGRRYNVHTANDPEVFVICDTPRLDFQLPEADPGSGHPAVEAALDLLMQELGVPRDELDVLSQESREWPDSCLGCARSQELCSMVITPGYRIEVMHEGIEYVVHTDAIGRTARLCGTLR